MALTEDSPLLKFVKKGDAAQLARTKGLETVGDLLEFVPRRYLPPGQSTDLSALRPGDDVMVVAEVATATTRPMRGRKGKMLTVVLADEGGNQLDLTFFSAYGHSAKLVPGARGVFAGTVGTYGSRLQLTHPDYELAADDEQAQAAAQYYESHLIPGLLGHRQDLLLPHPPDGRLRPRHRRPGARAAARRRPGRARAALAS